MKQWNETLEIAGRTIDSAAAGERAALATVVQIKGSAYRRTGAKLLIMESGSTIGGVSGGCLEANGREVGLSVIRDGVPSLCHYDTDDSTVWGLGLGCNGSVDILVQPATTPDTLEVTTRMQQLMAEDASFAVTTIVEGSSGSGLALVVVQGQIAAGSTGDPEFDRALAERSAALVDAQESKFYEFGAKSVFTQVYVPPPRLLIFGASDDALALASHASQVGFQVAAVDHRQIYLTRQRFPDATHLLCLRPSDSCDEIPLGPATYAVVKTHSLESDLEWIRRLLASDVPYIGALGPRARIKEMLERIGGQGQERVFGPVGLDIGADGPEQIAVSIVAEILALRAGRSPSHLREREETIHDR